MWEAFSCIEKVKTIWISLFVIAFGENLIFASPNAFLSGVLDFVHADVRVLFSLYYI